MWYILKKIALTQAVITAILLIVCFVLLPYNYTVDIILACVVAFCYAAFGMICIQNPRHVRRIVIRQVFRTLLTGWLIVILPLIISGRIGLVTLVCFVIIHALCWWWVFGRRSSSVMHRQLGK